MEGGVAQQLRCVGYVRVSKMGERDVEDEGFQSVRQQTEAIQAGVAALSPGARRVGEPEVGLAAVGAGAPRPNVPRRIGPPVVILPSVDVEPRFVPGFERFTILNAFDISPRNMRRIPRPVSLNSR